MFGINTYTYYMESDNKNEIPRKGLIDFEFYDEKCTIVAGFCDIDGYGVLEYDHELSLFELEKYNLFADIDNFTYLYDFISYDDTDYTDDGNIIIKGKIYEQEMTLSIHVPDSRCNRVLIDGVYYYY